MLINVKKEKDEFLKTITEQGIKVKTLEEAAKKDAKKSTYMKKQANSAKDENIKLQE